MKSITTFYPNHFVEKQLFGTFRFFIMKKTIDPYSLNY